MAKGNKVATGSVAKKGTHLVARTRGAILNAFDVAESRGRLLSEILADAFIENPLRFMDTAAKFIPKDIDLNVNHTKSAVQLTDEELADIIATRARERLEAAKEIEGEILEESDSYEVKAG